MAYVLECVPLEWVMRGAALTVPGTEKTQVPVQTGWGGTKKQLSL